MNRAEQAQQAELFRNKHRGPRLLLLPNAWDAMSARVFVAAGFDAIATTSGGVAWSLGYADGEQTPWAEVVAATARIVGAARAAVTADIEAGYGETPDAVMRSVAEIIGAGAVGVNLEDGTPHGPIPIRSPADAADRIRAAREAAKAAGVPIVINGRTDLYLRNIGDEASRFDETVERGRAYLAAGADCVYPIGLRDPATMGRLVQALGAPININVRAGSPSVAELEALGVARASTASQMALMAMSMTRQITDELRATGRFDTLAPAVSQADAQRLFTGLT
ncbi:MAG TPA: isocitrate lyase/phosphoenolpyruvate mutase family protein [Stellaceae bacterium]|jgi:2-methylisocitrate lyase-like PEP mutase family enzyme|nr:isocitrate lyase/phosphoenolpyruvate mutase family protein [Stellaceae bacterium]HEX3414815.1 isocitrate lyase/phosphoenolpyruvate mutase family protein [Stellaceae bacterium]